MDDLDATLSLEEVSRIFGRMRQPDLLRLAALAGAWSKGLPRRDATDLMNEALARVLSGQRPWPADTPMMAFLSQVMRSIASQWRREDCREPLLEDRDERPAGGTLEGEIEINELVKKIRHALRSDELALGIFEHCLLQSSRKTARAALDLDETGYDTTRRRMIRTLQREFNPGWDK